MKTRQQLCSFEQSKKLKELGVLQNGLFWFYDDKKDYNQIGCSLISEEITNILKKHFDYYSAFTVSELGVMLPNYMSSYRDEDKTYYTGIEEGLNISFGKTEAESRATCLIHLIETGKLKISDINTRMVF